ncbi:hypothetical protein [Verminephrobacter eiseniae]|uniref:hypothetical protein n=1 Tax=Verminephrobacter eiseniae TaxID=364317 RepID=UPI0005A52A00|nr:hypothetical protein [Verminephrobacter eiseniae]MCW5305772.1 hypothetical protein [Verminephrobacter eiseniae]MCW8179376.1 hypothetical protein [Verminephrobacter eiseniae]MCW8191737.1 hypothetical protein [Verminephrobacter eiseniae]
MLASLLICVIEPAGAASLVGGQTDDSVCDLGSAPQNARKLSAAGDFIRAQCKNGQVLVGSGIVPVGGFDSEVVRQARTFCRLVDIQTRRIQGNMAGLVMEIDEVRCTIGKLPT